MTVYAPPRTETEPKTRKAPGNFTRIDMKKVDGTLRGFPDIRGIRVEKWQALDNDEYRPSAWQWGRPDQVDINDEMTLDQMVAWLEGRGYRVYCWPNGARAFWGDPHPVRSARQMKLLRQRLTNRKQAGDPALQDVEIYGLDLRYQW